MYADLYRFLKYDFFKWFLIFDFFGFLTDSKYIFFSLYSSSSIPLPPFLFLCSLSVPLLLSVPFLIHYDIIYINIQLHFTLQLLQLLQAFRDLQPFRFYSRAAVPMVEQNRHSILYIYITLCTIQPLYYMLSIMQF